MFYLIKDNITKILLREEAKVHITEIQKYRNLEFQLLSLLTTRLNNNVCQACPLSSFYTIYEDTPIKYCNCFMFLTAVNNLSSNNVLNIQPRQSPYKGMVAQALLLLQSALPALTRQPGPVICLHSQNQ